MTSAGQASRPRFLHRWCGNQKQGLAADAGTAEEVARGAERRLEILLDAIRRERDLTGARMAATQTRASILVGSAGLVAGVDTLSVGPWWLPSVLYGLAVGLGIWALVPTTVPAIPVREYHTNITDFHPGELLDSILTMEEESNDRAAEIARFRSILTITGFALLAIGFGLSLVLGISEQLLLPPTILEVQIVEPDS